jgi:hypothetical protein
VLGYHWESWAWRGRHRPRFGDLDRGPCRSDRRGTSRIETCDDYREGYVDSMSPSQNEPSCFFDDRNWIGRIWACCHNLPSLDLRLGLSFEIETVILNRISAGSCKAKFSRLAATSRYRRTD